MEAGLPVAAFWEESVATFVPIMEAHARKLGNEAKAARNLALLTAYWAGHLSGADFKQVGTFDKFLRRFDGAPEITRAEAIVRLDRMAAQGLITRH